MSQQHPAPASDEKTKHAAREKLPAEKKFDQWVYGGISYAAQAGTGILLTHWIREGSGRKYFDKMAEWAGKAVIGKITGKTGAAATREADAWIVVSTMIMVGNAFLLPVKWLENHKPHYVRQINASINAAREERGETIRPEEKTKQEELLHQLEREPKQSWSSILGGRTFGLGAVYATLYAIGQKNNQWGENQFAGAVKTTLDTVGLKSIAESKMTDGYSRIAFYDFFYSMVSAGGLYVYSHFLHPHKKSTPETSPATPPQSLEYGEKSVATETNTKPLEKQASHAEKEIGKHAAAISRKPLSEPVAYAEKVQRDAQTTDYSMSV